jgi:hypothetical protein
MRGRLHQAALQRFSLGLIVAAGVPFVAMAWQASTLAIALAFGFGTIVALVGTQQLTRRRRRLPLQSLSVLTRQGRRAGTGLTP